ncbi:LysR family transcriptional regulator [Neobacillus sp. WH10]|uniref:LysR family transcriptional regulator n=1 Tax=Neobacillus sp. WH10 TaxID=3047873 RepID=UPI0024C0FE2C|nr:LysR family transcriptional regulator [Neobacillus sp. WH10]WHY79392.1 LysR family transcriptional regulator [Neobacillus sp. WH10]
MDVKQLRYFSTIAQEGQITRAAKKLHMAQPPLSQQLKLLEQELGVLLMDRNGKNIELTEAGKVLYKRAQEILQRFDETVTEVKEVGEGIRGLLSIGSVKTCFSYIPEKIRYFREHYPLVSFRLHEGDSFRLAKNIRNREIELAIVRLPLDLNDFSSLSLPNDRFVLVIPENWSSKKTIKMKKIAEMPLLLLHRISGVGLYELVVDECRRHGFDPNIVCQCADAAMLLSLVRTGIGAALLPQSTLLSFPPVSLKTIDIEDSTIESEAAVIWLKERSLSKSAVRFLETF